MYNSFINGIPSYKYHLSLLDEREVNKATRFLNKGQPKKDYNGKNPLTRTHDLDDLEVGWEMFTSHILKEFPWLKYPDNSQFIFDEKKNHDKVTILEYFQTASWQQIISHCKPEYRELFNIIRHDKYLYNVLLKGKDINTLDKFLKCLSILFYNFSNFKSGVLRIPRQKEYNKFKVGFSHSVMEHCLTYLIARGIVRTSLGKRYNDYTIMENGHIVYQEGCHYIPSFVFLTPRAKDLLQRAIKIYDQRPKGGNILRVVNNAKTDYAPGFESDIYKKSGGKKFACTAGLWKDEDSSIEIAASLGIIGSERVVREFYRYCSKIIYNCRLNYLKSVKSICYHLNEFWDKAQDYIKFPKQSISKFVKTIIFGQFETPIKNNFYITIDWNKFLIFK